MRLIYGRGLSWAENSFALQEKKTSYLIWIR